MRLAIGPPGLFLAALLTSCAASEPPPPPLWLPPPAARLQSVPDPGFRGGTNEDLLKYVQELRLALGQSNMDKEALRLFYSTDPSKAP